VEGITEALQNLFLLPENTGTVQLSSDKISTWITAFLIDQIFTAEQLGSICEHIVASGRFAETLADSGIYNPDFEVDDSIGCVVTLQTNEDNTMNILFKLGHAE
jgi:hypothetical protein